MIIGAVSQAVPEVLAEAEVSVVSVVAASAAEAQAEAGDN
jgi:hypothetical protein